MGRFRIQADPRIRAECDRVLELIRGAVPDAEVLEVGSTAIPGCIGKGDIDVLVRCGVGEFDGVRGRLDARFARNPEQLSNSVYQGYLVESALDVAIQLTVKGGEYDSFVEFIEALKADPWLVEEYNLLKREWDGKGMDEYREAKAAFIERVLARAKQA